MAFVIRSMRVFYKHLRVGDVFWHMTSRDSKPYEIEGPCKILALFTDKRFWLSTVRYARTHAEGETIEEMTIGDLTNDLHGVFLDPASAYAYLAERQGEYEKMAQRQDRALDRMLGVFGSM